mgnify:CR=1 FL=1
MSGCGSNNSFTVTVKVVDIVGNDTMTLESVNVG